MKQRIQEIAFLGDMKDDDTDRKDPSQSEGILIVEDPFSFLCLSDRQKHEDQKDEEDQGIERKHEIYFFFIREKKRSNRVFRT